MMTKIMNILALLVAVLTYAEGDSSEEFRVNSTFVDDNDLRPFEDNKRPLLSDWLVIKNKEVNREIHLVEGQTLTLTCEASGSRMPQIGWFKDDMQVTEIMDDENEIKPIGIVKIVQKFIAPCATLLHSGIYYCKGSLGEIRQESGITNVIVHRTRPGTSTGSCKVSRGKSRLTLFTQIMMQVMGTDVIIPCRATGIPNPNISWTKDKRAAKDKRIKILENGDLFVPKLRWTDIGEYRCEATNQYGTDTHTTFLYPLLKEE